MNPLENFIPEKFNYDLKSEKKEDIKVDYRNSNYKIIEISIPELCDNKISLSQNFILGKGGIFWDGAYFITEYLIKNIFNNKDYNIKNVLELGAGTSLPSIACLIKGYTVFTTDIPKLIPIIKQNMELNKNLFNKNSHSEVVELSWEKKECIDHILSMNDNKTFDLIIGSELIYLDDLFDDLINVLKIFSNKNTYIIFSYKIRLPEMVENFLNKLKVDFDYKFIDFELKNLLYPNPEKLQLIQIIKK